MTPMRTSMTYVSTATGSEVVPPQVTSAPDEALGSSPVPPALVILVNDPQAGDDAADAEARLTATLDLARQVAGVEGRILLVHPPEAEGRLTAKALGFRLWPQEGDNPGRRYANAFRQAVDLGYDGAVVIDTSTPGLPAERITEAATSLEQHHGAIIGDGDGGIVLLALQEPHDTLFVGDARPSYSEVTTRASQQRVRLIELADY